MNSIRRLCILVTQIADFPFQYGFQTEIRKVFGSAYDGHFVYLADITKIFTFARELTVYSLSEDGLSLPEVYLNSYPLAPSNQTSRNATASPVATINGEEVQLWMAKSAAQMGNGQDPDANYNYLTPGLQSGGNGGGFSVSRDYLGEQFPRWPSLPPIIS